VDAAVEPHRRVIALTYLALTLLDVGRTEEAVTLALDSAAECQRAGFETSFGAYLSGVAVEGLTRLGRWAEADTVLATTAGIEPVNVAAVELDTAGAVLSARRGDLDRARGLVERLTRLPSDGWHAAAIAAATAEVHLAAGEWAQAADTARRASAPTGGSEARWPPRFAALLTIAVVEQTLDAIARREAVDRDAAVFELRRAIDEARAHPASVGPIPEMHLALADAAITRLTTPDPEAFARAAEAAERAGDPWTAGIARLHEADAAAATGAAARAADALRTAHDSAARLGAQPLLRDIDALSRRARISVDVASAPAITVDDMARLGLTPREAEVLGLVAAGRTNREIGTQLYVSEKTASVHVSNILRKLGVATRVEAAAVAQRLGVA
jgi:ATP/maltotriose-dependent transcriptional regulator MalT